MSSQMFWCGLVLPRAEVAANMLQFSVLVFDFLRLVNPFEVDKVA
jgi:hypothetical protein